jgi:TorA maturation chaperone TorD
MRNPGLGEAIRAAGGVGALARAIGISQPSVSNWPRVPADRVLAVEAATGIDRAILRPDIYGASATTDEVDLARASEYALLAALLARPPDADLLRRLTRLPADRTPLGAAHDALAEAARAATAQTVEREYFDLFIGVGRGELLPYGSYYISGFLNERPLARLRNDLAKLGIERAPKEAEPEDHAAILCEIMASLASRRLSAPAGAEREIFETHLASWMPRFFADLAGAEAARFYRPVGALGRLFMEIEGAAFALPA